MQPSRINCQWDQCGRTASTHVRLGIPVEMMKDGPERLKKIHEVVAILDEDLPIVPGVHRIGNKLVQPWVKNYVYTDDMYYGSFLKFFRVQPKQ